MDLDPDGRALVPLRGIPPLELAERLEQATPRHAVYVDRRGQVRSPAYYRSVLVTSYAALGLVLSLAGALYYTVLGPLGVLLVAALAGKVGWTIRHTFLVQRALSLFAHDRFEEALVAADSVAYARYIPSKMRAVGHVQAAWCLAALGRHQGAICRYERALALFGRGRPPYAWLARYGAICALVELRRLVEARTMLEGLGSVPDTDFLRLGHWGAELYVEFGEGRHDHDDDDLFVRARKALGMSSASALLGLLAWAHAERGDTSMADHLLNEALDRHPGPRLAGSMPSLEAWMRARAASSKA